MPSSYRHIFKYTGLFGSVQVLYVLLSVVRNKAAALFIGAVGMGLADLFVRTIELIGNATNFGLGLSAVKHLSESFGKTTPTELSHMVSLIRTWVMLTALLGAAVCLLASPLISTITVGDMSRTADFAMLSPVVALTTLTGGEMAILKGTQRLKRLAGITAIGALITICLTVPAYWLWDIRGIIPAMLATTVVTYALNLHATTRCHPFRIHLFRPGFLRLGTPMLKLGAAYILAGVMTSGAELIVRMFLTRQPGGLACVGFYAAGFTLTVSYARIIFVAMDSDYFPRLSAAVGNRREQNILINRQINTLIVMMTPFLIALCLLLPLIIRVLYTSEFLAVIPMVLCAASYMYFKAVYTPIAYLPLAKGDSTVYMTMELIYDVVFCLLVIVGYSHWQLPGAGLALSAANLFDLALVATVYERRYGYRINRATLRLAVLLFATLALGIFAASRSEVGEKAILGAAALALSALFSLPILRQLFKR